MSFRVPNSHAYRSARHVPRRLPRELRILRALPEGAHRRHHQLEGDTSVILKATQLARVRFSGLRYENINKRQSRNTVLDSIICQCVA